MKTITKQLFRSLSIIGGLVASLNFVHGQTLAQPASADSVVQVVADSQGLQLIPSDQIPAFGTFWVVTGTQSIVPWPVFPPLNDPATTPVYSLGADGQFLVDATGGVVPQPTERRAAMGVSSATLIQAQADAVANLITQVQTTAANQQAQAMAGNTMAMGAPMPGDGSGDGGTNSYTPDYSSYTVDYGSNLWVANFGLSSGNAVGVVSNTTADISYEIQYKNDLTSTQWLSTGFFILGSELTNWTAMSIPGVSLTNNAFFRIRSWASSDESGLPDWWELEYFGTTGINPNALDPAGDGWSIWQDFEAGYSPLVFHTPPAPQGLTASYNADNTATVSWQPSPGPVTGYTVVRHYYTYAFPINDNSQIFNVSAGTTSLHDATSFTSPYYVEQDGLTVMVSYQIQAHYAGGDSAWSNPVWLEPSPSDISLVAGPQGSVYFAARNLPAGTTALRLMRLDEYLETQNGDSPANIVSFDIPLSTGTNGLYPIPAEAAASPADAYGHAAYQWFAQPINANGQGTSQEIGFGYGFYSQLIPQSWIVPPYFDGRAQLKQNLIFLLRAATVDFPFYYQDRNGLARETLVNSAAYAYSAFNSPYPINGESIQSLFDVFSPFHNNYLYRNFVYSLADVDSGGHISTGVSGDYSDPYENGLVLLDPPLGYQFQPPTTSGTAIGALLATNQTQWLCSYPLDSPEMYYDPPTDSMISYGYLEEIGVTPSVDTSLNQWETMAANARNVYGLPFVSAKIAWGNTSGATYTLSAGSQVENVDGYFYPQTAQPQFQTVEYDFWNPKQPGYNSMYWLRDSLPGGANFSTTNTSDVLIAGVADPSFQVAGYAKLALLNGYSGVYGYLGQYFDQAYQVDTNGNITTNTTGTLSPYGSFFATTPGQAALVTMPDVDTGARGTGIVSCISVNLNKRHNGGMDLSFNGPDATSPNSPYIFFANNNYDRWATNQSPLGGVAYTDIEQDDQPIASNPGTSIAEPDCNYSNRLANGYSFRAIPCTRDLEDFARLWVCGITTNLLAALPSGSTITLNWGDVGSPNSGNPTIDLFAAADADGGIGYLTNETVATIQTNIFQCPYLGRLAPGGSIQLNAIQFANSWAGNHFIWCGVSNGTGGLNLTIADGNGNVLAQSTAYIQIVDIKQMYERWTVGDNPTNAPVAVPYLVSDNSPAGVLTFQYTTPTDTNTPYILHVHGFNMETWVKDRYAETEFKRLYWQGYQGRFGSFRWPTTFTFYTKFFDDSESNAWASAKGLLNLLTNLNAEYPGHVYLTAHSHGNVVVGEALKQATQQGLGQIVNTYVAMQAAVDSHTYDPTTPTRPVLFSTPDRYGQYYTNGASCYFNGSAGAGTYVNFFNINDWALTITWQLDQNLKWDIGYNYQSSIDTWWQIGLILNTELVFPQNTYTIYSYCDQAHAYALGAQPNVGGAFKTLTYNQVALPSVWPPDNSSNTPYSDHIWHSAEFRSDNPQRWLFWDEVLFQMGLKKSL